MERHNALSTRFSARGKTPGVWRGWLGGQMSMEATEIHIPLPLLLTIFGGPKGIVFHNVPGYLVLSYLYRLTMFVKPF